MEFLCFSKLGHCDDRLNNINITKVSTRRLAALVTQVLGFTEDRDGRGSS